MKTKDVMIVARRPAPHQVGEVPGQVIVCDQCDNDAFAIFFVEEHNHLQCTACGTSYCQSGRNCQLTLH